MRHLMHSLFGLLLVAVLAGCSSKGGTTDGEMAAVDDRGMGAGEGGRYRIAVQDLDTGLLRILTDGQLDESPSFSPNGSMIIYATDAGNRGVMAAVSTDGRFRQRLSIQAGDVREPVWSPYVK